MKLIIAGSRHLDIPEEMVSWCLDKFYLKEEVREVVCGEADGVDTAGEVWGLNNYKNIASFPADWDFHGKAAGPIRNKEMAEYADALLLIWDGVSPGSKNMKKQMQDLNKPIYEYIIKRVV